jgi:hypothetical protein
MNHMIPPKSYDGCRAPTPAIHLHPDFFKEPFPACQTSSSPQLCYAKRSPSPFEDLTTSQFVHSPCLQSELPKVTLELLGGEVWLKGTMLFLKLPLVTTSFVGDLTLITDDRDAFTKREQSEELMYVKRKEKEKSVHTHLTRLPCLYMEHRPHSARPLIRR